MRTSQYLVFIAIVFSLRDAAARAWRLEARRNPAISRTSFGSDESVVDADGTDQEAIVDATPMVPVAVGGSNMMSDVCFRVRKYRIDAV